MGLTVSTGNSCSPKRSEEFCFHKSSCANCCKNVSQPVGCEKGKLGRDGYLEVILVYHGRPGMGGITVVCSQMISFAFLAGNQGVRVFERVDMRNVGSRVSNSGCGDSLGFSSAYSLGRLHIQT